MEEKPAIVLDCGTSWCRAGFSYTPDSLQVPVAIPNVIGNPKHERCKGKQTYFIGEMAVSKRKELNIKYPIEYGFITRWDGMELMWQALINDKLGVQAEEHPFLLVQTGNVPRCNLEKTSEIFFENFNVPSLCFRSSGELSLLASGGSPGTIVEIGGGACFPVPVVEGYALKHFMQRTEFCGRDLTATLSRMMPKCTDSSTAPADQFNIMNSIKEKYCYCAQDYENECLTFSKEKEILYIPPGGDKPIRIGKEQFQCPESLFKPHLAEKEFPGLHEIVFKCIRLIDDQAVQFQLFSNVVLCGGSSSFPGLAPRLQKELECLAKSKGIRPDINVTVSPHQHAAFHGGTLAACWNDFLDRSVSKEFYDEYGPFGISSFFK